jgi:Protein of unknown function (DUF3592)
VVVTSETETYPRNSQQGTVNDSNTTIEYAYQVGGRAYTGTGIYPTSTVTDNAAYSLGSNQIWIFYDPRNPAQSRIAPSVSAIGVIFGILGIIFLGGLMANALANHRRKTAAGSSQLKGA